MNEEQQNEEKKKESGEWGDWGKGSKEWGKWHKGRQDWRQDRLDSAGWGLFFLLGALIIVAEVTKFSDSLSWWNGWSIF